MVLIRQGKRQIVSSHHLLIWTICLLVATIYPKPVWGEQNGTVLIDLKLYRPSKLHPGFWHFLTLAAFLGPFPAFSGLLPAFFLLSGY